MKLLIWRIKLTLVLLFLINRCFSTPYLAQNNSIKIDSLKSLLQTNIHDTLRATVLTELGDALILKSHSEALTYYYQSKQLSEKTQDTTGIVFNLLGISDIHSMMGEYKQALSFISEAHILSHNNYDLLAATHSRLAIEYYQIGEHKLSMKNDRLSLKYNALMKDTLQMAYDYHNIAAYYLTINQVDSALYHYKLSNHLLGTRKDVLRAYNNSRMGFAHSQLEDYDTAILFHQKALVLFTQDSLIYDLAMEENYIAFAFLNNHQINEAFNHANKALEYTKMLNNPNLYIQNYNLLYDIYNYKQDYKNALKYTLLKIAYTDSLEQKNKENLALTSETRWKFTEQKRVLEASEKNNFELTKQKYKLIAFSLISALLLVISIVFIIQRRVELNKNKLLVKKLDRLSQSRHKLLSIIGHDLRGSVGNLKNLTELMHHNLLDNQSIETMLTKFVPMVDSTHSLLETLLVWSRNNDDNFALKKEMISAENVVTTTIEHMSHLAWAKHINIIHETDDIEFIADRNMIMTVLRNLISNAIKFSNEHSKIWISYLTSGSNIEFCVKDEGIGMTMDEIDQVMRPEEQFINEGTKGEKGAGLGLKLCNEFISKHGGQLIINSKPEKGSEFKFVIPISASL